ncbi:MAG: hypothetical protein V1775_18905 [Bacteroidota bacterium]
MKSYRPLCPSDVTSIEISWSEPQLIQGFKDPEVEYPDNGYFYKFIGIHGKSNRLFYIGKTYSRYVSRRIKDADHKRKQEEFHKSHPKHKLYISVGFIPPRKKISPKFISDIENLLIYAHSNDDFKFLKNRKSIYNHHVIKNYHIINQGYLDDHMLPEIYYGLFIRD